MTDLDGGLRTDEARRRLRRFGPNVLPRATRSPLVALVAQLTHLMALLLWIGGALAFVAALPQLGVAIWLVNLINGGFAFWQEHRAERAAEALAALLPAQARVVRDGREQVIVASGLVPGDLVVLGEGDRICADLRLVRSTGIEVGEAALTGESEAVAKSSEGVGDAGLLFAGTMVLRGQAHGVVTATGADTRIGRVARATLAVHAALSPLQRELQVVTRVVALLAVGSGVIFFLLAVALTDMAGGAALILALGMIVAFVPEGLVPTLTLALARSTGRMAARNVLVRRLAAVEALGATQVICCDKTGTLTCNRMEVAELVPAGARARALRVMALCNDVSADGDRGDPTETALVEAARAAGADRAALARALPRIAAFAFDYDRRRMTTVHGDGDGALGLTKGAPGDVVERCALAAAERERILAEAGAMAGRGLRVLALAERRFDGPVPDAADEVERELAFAGLVGLRDPPRPQAASAIAACHAAGIRVIMVTGDHPAAAGAIARQLGLVTRTPRVVTGDELAALSNAELDQLLAGDVVLARIRPEQKLRVVVALQRMGLVVAVTGDGVNDAPALRQADIGVAMGQSGTDVAREAADIILLDDNFSSIVAGIEEGRAVYDNVRRFTSYIFTSNAPEAVPFVVFALSGGRVPLALGVMHVLAIDLGTDLVPALALGAEPPAEGVMRRPPRGRHDHVVTARLLVRAYVWLGVVQAAVVMLAFLAHLRWNAAGAGSWLDVAPGGELHRSASGFALAAVVATQIGNLFAHRQGLGAPRRRGPSHNPLLLPALAVEIALLLGFLYLPPLQRAIGTAPFPAWQWLVLVAVAPVLLAVDALRRWVSSRFRTGSTGTGWLPRGGTAPRWS